MKKSEREETERELLKLQIEMYVALTKLSFSEKLALDIVLGNKDLINPFDIIKRGYDKEKFK